jgi:hypothetical protein
MIEYSSFYVISPVDSLGNKNVLSNNLRNLIRATPALNNRVIYNKKHQSPKDILRTKDSATIYYITMVNDAYISLFAKSKTTINGKQFLLTNNENECASNFGISKDNIVNNSNLFAIEIKSS